MTPHKITVTAVPNMDEDLPDDQYIDEVKYTVECPGESSCQLWWECQQCIKDEYEPTEDQEDDGEYTRHGVFHRGIEGMWCTESKQCAAIHSDSCQESVYEAAEEAGIGTHQIELDYQGDEYWTVQIIHPPEVESEIENRAKALLSSVRTTEWDKAGHALRQYFRHRAWKEIKRDRQT
ncbi:hypothetical protein [Arthrobacter sp. StoSoilB22]|uniref:hypothetical protein n=1 Tax=Arthrobacter sp. StoSoilB22 TaxID=2830996 RepID=UPI001CC3CEF6|nr:hypothetical protein [Arthrobacter sp. StoSoilB22]BCW61864.1 hypothetical protein StoSoilB22_08370 [Arthrobacter sp. StoSoilB22]